MNAANGAACTIKNCYSTGNVYTLTADSKELSASCSTKSGDDYAENVYASGKVLVWNTETENKNATVPGLRRSRGQPRHRRLRRHESRHRCVERRIRQHADTQGHPRRASDLRIVTQTPRRA